MPQEIQEVRELSFEVRCSAFGMSADQLFRFSHLLSKEIEQGTWAKSLLKQPKLFLRIRPGKKDMVLKALTDAQQSFEEKGDCLTLSNAVRVEDMIRLNKDAVVQDFNSQQVLDYLKKKALPSTPLTVWDACAASGGKSILINDILKGNLKLTVSDKRISMLKNLRQRLAEASVPVFQIMQKDLTVSSSPVFDSTFDIIICDVPCTGSGTWARTPEQHIGFQEQQLQEFQQTQYSIVRNVLPHLTYGGILFYITCSVFMAENEEVCKKLMEENSLTLLHQQYLKGYNEGADTMFVSVFSPRL